MPPIQMTESEMLAALAATSRTVVGEDGMTAQEVAARLGVGINRARAVLRHLIREGTMRAVKVRRTALDGRMDIRPGYQFVAAPAPQK